MSRSSSTLFDPDVSCVVAHASCSASSSRMPSTSPTHAAYIRAIDQRVADAVRGRDLGRVQGARVPDVGTGERAARREQGFAEHRLRTHDLVDERARLGIGHDCGVDETADERRDARLLRRGQADPEVEAERFRDRVAEVQTNGGACDTPNHLAHEVAVRNGVIPVLRTRLPVRHLLGERVDDGIPRECLLERHLTVGPREPRLVRQEVRDGQVGLAALRELGPVLRDGCVDVELTFLRELVRAYGRRAFRRREHELDRVLLPRSPAGLVGHTTPKVDDLLAAVVRAERRAHLEALGEVVLEDLVDAFEARCGGAVGRSHTPVLARGHHSLSSPVHTRNSAVEFVRGNGVSGSGTSRKAHRGSQPSPTSNTRSRSRGTDAITSASWARRAATTLS